MKKINLLFCMTVLLTVLFGCSTPNNTKNDTPEEVNLIGKFERTTGDHGNAHTEITICSDKLTIDYYPSGKGVPVRLSKLEHFEFNTKGQIFEFDTTNNTIEFTASGFDSDSHVEATLTGKITAAGNGINLKVLKTTNNGSDELPYDDSDEQTNNKEHTNDKQNRLLKENTEGRYTRIK